MTQQTFPFGEGIAPRVVINQVEGDLVVRTWDEQGIKIETGGRLSQLYQEGDTLVLTRCDDDIDLWVPKTTSVSATDVDGDVSIEGIARVELTNIDGDTDLEDISEAVVLARVNSDVSVSSTPELHIRSHTGSDVTLRSVGVADIEAVGVDLSINEARAVVVGTVGSSLDADYVTEALRVGNVGADCQVQGSAHTEVTVGNVGADITVNGASTVQIGNVGASCEVSDVEGDAEIGYVGADVTVSGVGGNLHIGGAGADAELSGLQGNIEVGSIGSDLQLQAAFAPDSVARLNVGGDASIILPNEPNLSIQAAVGGDVSGHSIVSSGGGNVVSLVYGDGAAHLELNVGGDLDLRGGKSPRTSSSTSGSWKEFEREMASLGKEMSKMGQELGKEMSKMGEELRRDLGQAIGGTSAYGGEWANEIAHKVEERMRRAQQRAEEHARRSAERSRHYAEEQGRRAGEQARRAEEQARRAEEQARRSREQGARLNVRINDREWRIGPDRLERIQEEARKAAAEGIAGALEAVERAFSNLRIPTPPTPPTPPSPAASPSQVPPVPPVPPVSPVNPVSPAGPAEAVEQEPAAQSETQAQQGQSQSAGEQSASNAPVDPEKEREAILRMIAEGRITPEEGDLLLESLGG